MAGVTPDGEVLIVTEKNTNHIDLFPIDDGSTSGSSSAPSNGATPFGLTFGRDGSLNGFRVQEDGTLAPVATVAGLPLPASIQAIAAR